MNFLSHKYDFLMNISIQSWDLIRTSNTLVLILVILVVINFLNAIVIHLIVLQTLKYHNIFEVCLLKYHQGSLLDPPGFSIRIWLVEGGTFFWKFCWGGWVVGLKVFCPWQTFVVMKSHKFSWKYAPQVVHFWRFPCELTHFVVQISWFFLWLQHPNSSSNSKN